MRDDPLNLPPPEPPPPASLRGLYIFCIAGLSAIVLGIVLLVCVGRLFGPGG